MDLGVQDSALLAGKEQNREVDIRPPTNLLRWEEDVRNQPQRNLASGRHLVGAEGTVGGRSSSELMSEIKTLFREVKPKPKPAH